MKLRKHSVQCLRFTTLPVGKKCLAKNFHDLFLSLPMTFFGSCNQFSCCACFILCVVVYNRNMCEMKPCLNLWQVYTVLFIRNEIFKKWLLR